MDLSDFSSRGSVRKFPYRLGFSLIVLEAVLNKENEILLLIRKNNFVLFSPDTGGKGGKKKHCCRNPGSNQGPLDLQSNALPTELFRLSCEPSPQCTLKSFSEASLLLHCKGRMAMLGGSDCKEYAHNAGDLGSIPGLGRSSGEREMATHSSILAWRIPQKDRA